MSSSELHPGLQAPVGISVRPTPGSPTAAATEHLLALKVMRLTRPTFAMPLVVTSDPSSRDLPKDTLNAQLRRDANSLQGLEELCIGQTLVLPQSFGNIYLGETFCSYVCLHNDSTESCTRVSLKCDLQTATQRIPLYPGPNEPPFTDNFLSGSSINHVLHHEVKELGTHILVCEVTYAAPHREKLNFRKFFKFQVMKPLDVKTKFYNAESDEVFLEAQVQNVTNGVLSLEKVLLEPSQLFGVTSLNAVQEEDEAGTEVTRSVFGKVNSLQPQDSRQYLFCLTPKPEVKSNHKLMRGVTNIGKLDIVWRTAMGDRGRLQTSQLQRMAPNHGDVRFTIETIPSLVRLDRAFAIGARIINNCERTLELELNLVSLNRQCMAWSGITTRKLGLVEPSGSVDISLEAVPHDTGLQSISGIRVTDSLLKRTYEFDDQCPVFVCDDQEFLDALSL